MTFYDSSAFFRGKSTNVEGLYSILFLDLLKSKLGSYRR